MTGFASALAGHAAWDHNAHFVILTEVKKSYNSMGGFWGEKMINLSFPPPTSTFEGRLRRESIPLTSFPRKRESSIIKYFLDSGSSPEWRIEELCKGLNVTTGKNLIPDQETVSQQEKMSFRTKARNLKTLKLLESRFLASLQNGIKVNYDTVSPGREVFRVLSFSMSILGWPQTNIYKRSWLGGIISPQA